MNANDIKIAEWAKSRPLPDGSRDSSRVLCGCVALEYEAVDVAAHADGVSMFHASMKGGAGIRWKRIDIGLDGVARYYLQTYPAGKAPVFIREPQPDAIIASEAEAVARAEPPSPTRKLLASLGADETPVPVPEEAVWDAMLAEVSEDGFPTAWLDDEDGAPEAVADEVTSPIDTSP